MNYRAFYESELKVSLPESFEVHHIDENRENNLITNLVALPKELHQKYHLLKPKTVLTLVDFNLRGTIEIGSASFQCYVHELTAFMYVRYECNKWIDYRDYLRGIIPNFNKLSYGA